MQKVLILGVMYLPEMLILTVKDPKHGHKQCRVDGKAVVSL